MALLAVARAHLTRRWTRWISKRNRAVRARVGLLVESDHDDVIGAAPNASRGAAGGLAARATGMADEKHAVRAEGHHARITNDEDRRSIEQDDRTLLTSLHR